MIQCLLSHDAVQLRPMLFFSDETYFPVVSWASRLNWLFTQYFFFLQLNFDSIGSFFSASNFGCWLRSCLHFLFIPCRGDLTREFCISLKIYPSFFSFSFFFLFCFTFFFSTLFFLWDLLREIVRSLAINSVPRISRDPLEVASVAQSFSSFF